MPQPQPQPHPTSSFELVAGSSTGSIEDHDDVTMSREMDSEIQSTGKEKDVGRSVDKHVLSDYEDEDEDKAHAEDINDSLLSVAHIDSLFENSSINSSSGNVSNNSSIDHSLQTGGGLRGSASLALGGRPLRRNLNPLRSSIPTIPNIKSSTDFDTYSSYNASSGRVGGGGGRSSTNDDISFIEQNIDILEDFSMLESESLLAIEAKYLSYGGR